MRRAFGALLVAWSLPVLAMAGEEAGGEEAEVVRIADGQLQVGLDSVHGMLRELRQLPDGPNQLADNPAPLGLWQLTVRDGETSYELSAEQAGPVRMERLDGEPPGLRLVWDQAAATGRRPLRVEVLVRLGVQDAALSRWELSVAKPKDVLLEQVRFPRLSSLRERGEEVLAVPRELGALARNPRQLAQGKNQQGARLLWRYPWVMALQCLALYQPDGPGFYAACDDAQCYRKEFALWGDAQAQLHFEILHEPEQAAVETAEFRLPFAVVLGAFRGDWTTAAEFYRRSPGAQAIAERGRLRRHLTPDWLPETGLWVWNRGRSPGVLPPAAILREHLQTPVSVLWHWWHHCAYDAGFPEYLPPRDGAAAFQSALAAARQQDVHAILYMNQRLWGMQTESWVDEQAERYAVKGADGKIRPEVYNVFMQAPCVPMCIGTRFWRDKYAGLAREVFCGLQADGVYMDQTGVMADCYDPSHGHILGGGRYWTDGLAMLTSEIRDRCSTRGRVALGGEFCGEPWMGNLDLTLALSVSADRIGLKPPWEPIPFFQAVYHGSTIVFGNYAGLVQPPYDEKWPPEKTLPDNLTLMDRKYRQQFLLEQARTFVWGMQPMLANFLPDQLQTRPEEIDFVTRLVRTRMRSLKYLLHGSWLRPPPLDIPQQEIDVAQIGVYTPLRASQRTYPLALAGAWQAAGGDVAIALASIHDQPLPLQLPINAQAYGLTERCAVYRIDEAGCQRLGAYTPGESVWQIELPPRGLCLVEFRQSERQ